MEEFSFIEYMRDIAIKLKDVGHIENDDKNRRFFRVSGIANIEEFLQNLTNVTGYCLMVEDIDDHTGNIFSSNSQNWLDTQTYVYFVVKQVGLLDFDDKELILTGCKQVGLKIIAKIIQDWEQENKGQKARTPLFTWDQRLQHTVVGPIGDNFFGIMYQITFTPNIAKKLVVDPTDWND